MELCNMCGCKIDDSYSNDRQEYLKVKKDWGYFSDKDLETHEFVLCEKCYDEFIKKMIIPITITQRNEAV